MKILKKVERFLELSNMSSRNESEQKELVSLRRMLTARGLDPRHQTGLRERAIVFDNIKLVQDYIEIAERAEHADKISNKAQNALNDTIAKLRKLGIENINRRSLQTILNELKQNAKAADRLKRTKTTRAPHKSPAIDEEIYDDADDEYDEEDDVYAVPAEVAAF